ncbi:deoxyribodipyrimidine photo-lyase [Niastella sp. MAH-29]|uniref:Deoxyribodipyrimidine photo-lyase n=1 Tax=Niastella soli TaxID=2821487 RepID=A0ABS3YU84_9BACT|nr:deoxyribodipyrimidine photo-lyase [Niastella soli]
MPIFIFDTYILEQLPDKRDSRVEFIHDALTGLQDQLKELGSTLIVYHDTPLQAFKQLVKHYTIEQVYTNHDYEPYARERDDSIAQFLQEHSITFHTYKDQVIFDKLEVVKDDGKPYTIFTPYSKKWKAKLNKFYLKSYPVKKYVGNFHQQAAKRVPSLKAIGFEKTDAAFPADSPDNAIIKHYDKQRDIPGITGTSHLGVHLRFGTISIRQLVQKTMKLNETFLNELIWRDFFQMILWHFPHVGQGKAFKAEYDFIKWRNNEEEFTRWCEGTTGYPIVDAGMRELNTTGFMHNRVRMITASFLAKHLLIDWRWGEAYFAEKLLDYELASNNGNWQWAAGCGCDAAPYFRIFNPYTQTKKFDPQNTYIKKWVPEYEDDSYPAPIVEHDKARERCLETYKKALAKAR